jgi:CheY-like chemotaxis protein
VTDARRVLVVDSESATEEVLKAVLEPRGLRVDRVRDLASSSAAGRPTVLIIDDDRPAAEIRGEPGWAGVPRVVIGSARLPDASGEHAGRYLQKPFQYPELIRLIDQLLSGRAA